jgi:SAM-dependent methyltransferase
MNRLKLTDIGHRHLRFANPIGESKIDRLIDLLPLKKSQTALDIGAGKCEFLLRLIRRYRVAAVGVDIRPDVAPKSRGRLRVIIQDAKRFEPARPFDVAACIGATHALGGYLPTLKALTGWVKPGGFIVVGEGFWMKEPASGYLKVLNGRRDEFVTHERNIALAEAMGLIPLWCVTSSRDEWDEYEWSYTRSIEGYAEAHPGDSDCLPMLNHIRAFRRAQMKWGRDTLGFGLYLFRKNPTL